MLVLLLVLAFVSATVSQHVCESLEILDVVEFFLKYIMIDFSCNVGLFGVPLFYIDTEYCGMKETTSAWHFGGHSILVDYDPDLSCGMAFLIIPEETRRNIKTEDGQVLRNELIHLISELAE